LLTAEERSGQLMHVSDELEARLQEATGLEEKMQVLQSLELELHEREARLRAEHEAVDAECAAVQAARRQLEEDEERIGLVIAELEEREAALKAAEEDLTARATAVEAAVERAEGREAEIAQGREDLETQRSQLVSSHVPACMGSFYFFLLPACAYNSIEVLIVAKIICRNLSTRQSLACVTS